MIQDKSLLSEKIIDSLFELRKSKIKKKFEMPRIGDLSNNEKLVLFILNGIIKEKQSSQIKLSDLRYKIKLAPSTLTPVITSLENKKFIERKIDKNDRRNIYLKISKKGLEYISILEQDLNKHIIEYIEFMGTDDINELLKLLTKTIEFFNKEEEK